MLPYRVSICGLDELDRFAGAGVSHVISLLDPDWPYPEAVDRLGAAERHEFRLHDVIAEGPDRRAPLPADVERLLEIGERLAAAEVEHLLVHCHMGLSRSTAAALILKTQHAPGREAEAVAALMAVRNPLWPNSRMIAHADALLDRDGRLIEAARDIYVRVTREHPHIAEMIRRTERAGEVPEAEAEAEPDAEARPA